MDPQLLLDCFPHTTTHRYNAAADNNNYNPNYTTTTASKQLLPPGFRFHPTDEELITYYLLKKVMDSTFSGRAIAEVDLNKCEPWHLPEKAKMGEKEWYFFSLRDRKYPTGLRTNRATEAGYWKATGKDREIYSTKTSALVGMKKTLVFYRGRAPKGEKSNWVMHEYRLDGKFAYHYLSRSSKDEWVISRVFQKSGVGAGGNGCTASNNSAASSAKKPRSSAAMSSGSSAYQEVSSPPSAVSHLPALLDPTTADSYSYGGGGAGRHHQQQHVSCFSTGTTSSTTTVAAAAASDHHHQMMTMFNNNGLMMSPDHHHYQRNVLSSTTSAFPSLRSLQENLNLPLPHHLFFPPPPTSASAVFPPSSFGGGGMMSWMEEGKVGTASELDCMWTY
ncbi:unnamed protein product [Linum trigynum]|uniref:NAC domain-containing protein n=1 Tax=Linum trigynum TaxID=586398 RepID=A0AAV2DHH6_9ROSI